MTTAPPHRPDGVAKLAMRAFLGLLVINAFVAIAAILGATGDSDWKVVGTTLLLTAGCLTIAANAAALERDRLMQLPYVGAALSCIAFAIFIVLIWVESNSDNDFVWKSTLILLTLGLAATYASVLAIPRLEAVFSTARLVGYATVALLAVLTTAAIMAEGGVSAQVYAVLSVVLATATIIVLTGAIIESRKPTTGGSRATLPSSAGVYCPACGASIDSSVLAATHMCGNCGLGFSVQVVSPRTG